MVAGVLCASAAGVYLEAVETLALLTTTEVDVLLLDLRMPRLDGIGVLKAITRPPTLVLTTFDDDELVVGALKAGARGYLLKDVTLEELRHAIRTLHGGGHLIQPAVTELLALAERTVKNHISSILAKLGTGRGRRCARSASA